MTKINGFQRVSVQTDRRNEIARSILVKEQLGLGLGLGDPSEEPYFTKLASEWNPQNYDMEG